MSFIGFLIILVISLVLSFFFAIALSARGPWGNFWTFFLILFLGVLAISFWIEPIGPVFGETNWVPLLVAGIIIGLMLAMAGNKEPRKRKRNAITGKVIKVESDTSPRVGVFFWILITLFALAILIGVFF